MTFGIMWERESDCTTAIKKEGKIDGVILLLDLEAPFGSIDSTVLNIGDVLVESLHQIRLGLHCGNVPRLVFVGLSARISHY